MQQNSPFFTTHLDLNHPLVIEYSPWGHWTKCTKSCGGGMRTRSRMCSAIFTMGDWNSMRCVEKGLGPDKEVDGCNKEGCPGIM